MGYHVLGSFPLSQEPIFDFFPIAKSRKCQVPFFLAMNYFNPFSRSGAQWTFVGLTSTFPDVDDDAGNLAKHRLCNTKSIPGCKAFHIPKEDCSSSKEVPIGDDALGQSLTDQVLVFQYKGKFHAVDHVSK